MSNLTAQGLIECTKGKLGTEYVYGAKGEILTQAKYDQLKKAYGNNVWDSDKSKIGKWCVDCSGLISWSCCRTSVSFLPPLYATSPPRGLLPDPPSSLHPR